MIKGIKVLLAILFVFLVCNTASAKSNDIKSGIAADAAAFQMPSHIWGKIKLIAGRGGRPGGCEDNVVDDVCDPGTGVDNGAGEVGDDRGRGGRPGGCEDDVVDDVCDPGTGGVGGVGDAGNARPFRNFEGIWSVPFSNIYISFNKEGLVLIGISIDISTFEAGFVIGNISGNTATLTQHNGSDEFNVVLEGLSKNQAKATVVACSPQPSCGVFEPGAVLELLKVF